MSSALMIKTLGEQIAYDKLAKEDLERLSRGEEVAMEMVQLGRVISSIGCLVSSDGEHKDHPQAGNFQSAGDVTELLFCLGEIVEAKGELVNISNMARWKLGILNGASQ